MVRYEIMQPGAFAFLKVQLEAGESIKAESDAMMAMSGNIKVEGKMEGGMLGGLASASAIATHALPPLSIVIVGAVAWRAIMLA